MPYATNQNLRQINFGDSRCANSAILTLLETLNFDFYEFLQFFRFSTPKMAKLASLEVENSLN